MAEQLIRNEQVVSSILTTSSRKLFETFTFQGVFTFLVLIMIHFTSLDCLYCGIAIKTRPNN